MKIKGLGFFLVISVLVSSMAIGLLNAAPTANITIDPTTQHFPNAKVGDSIQINIVINDVQGLWAWDIVGLKFNPAILNITSAAEGPFLKAAVDEGKSLFIWTSNNPTQFAKGIIPDISNTLLELKTSSGSGVLATLTFTVVSLGVSQISFNQTTLDSSSQTQGNFVQIPCTMTNADITIGPTTTTSSPTPTTSSTTSPTPSSNPTSPSTSPTSSSLSSPTPTAPEFPATTIIVLLIAATTISIALLTKKANLNKR